MSYDHASEKFYTAVDLLASGSKPVEDRLPAALIEIFRLREEEVPPDVLKDFQELKSKSSQHDSEESVKMPAEDSRDVASKIVSMFVRVEKAFHLG